MQDYSSTAATINNNGSSFFPFIQEGSDATTNQYEYASFRCEHTATQPHLSLPDLPNTSGRAHAQALGGCCRYPVKISVNSCSVSTRCLQRRSAYIHCRWPSICSTLWQKQCFWVLLALLASGIGTLHLPYTLPSGRSVIIYQLIADVIHIRSSTHSPCTVAY